MLVTKELKSTETSKRSSYKDIIGCFNKKWPAIITKYKITMPNDNWIKEALSIVIKVESILKDKEALDAYLATGEIKWKVTSSIITLTEFQFVIENLHYFKEENHSELARKLRDVVKMPLLVKNESSDDGTNAGRNSLFELRLYLKFAIAGFDTTLCEHPDILVKVNGREYAIECKRIFSEKALIRNVTKARDQIKYYSLTSRNRFGIVALSITRAFHSGDLKLVTETIEKASNTVSYYMDLLYKQHAKEINNLLNYKFPVILFDYSDISEVDVPFWIQKMSLYKLVSSNRVLNDLEALSKTNLF